MLIDEVLQTIKDNSMFSEGDKVIVAVSGGADSMSLLNILYEIKNKLYELDELYHKRQFFRCSKSVLINLLKVESVKPALNGRFTAKLSNGEQIIISRQYVAELKRILKI